jgi:ribose transport system ATP-binding protein
LLRAEHLSKSFAGINVLRDVDLSVEAGEVHGLIGQNGSGKSTLIKILTGFHPPDPGGRLSLRGREVSLPVSPRRVSALGLGVMHQDHGLERSLSVLDNFLIDGSGSPVRRIRWRRERQRVTDELAAYGLHTDVRRPVQQLSPSERAVFAVARAFDRMGGEDQGLLIMDEPTSSLERGDVEKLFKSIEVAKARGCGVLFVSHDLAEVRRICNTVSVLRDGALVAEGNMSEFTELDLIRAIVGKDIGEMYPPRPARRRTPVLLEARNLSGDLLRDCSLEIHEGEIVGVTGLAGMGQDELVELLYGSQPIRGGEVHLFGQAHDPVPGKSIASGMVLLPADRKGLGGDAYSSIEENLTVPIAKRYFRRGRMDRGSAIRDVRAVLREFDVRPPEPRRLLGELSGGNQQKALLAKWLKLFGQARVLLLHEATQGVDVGARQDIFRTIREGAKAGLGILYVSTEHEDLAHLCDRVIVMRHGRIAAEMENTNLQAETITAMALAGEGDLIDAGRGTNGPV